MTKKKRRNYPNEFRLESAQLVVDQGYRIQEAADAVGVSYSAMERWVRQLRLERNGQEPSTSPMTPEQIEIKALKKQIARLKEHNDILKKATALLMSDSMSDFR